jgi:hypothetical protein
VAIVNTAELDRARRGLRKRHTPAATFTRHALIGDDVVFGSAAEIFGGDLL